MTTAPDQKNEKGEWIACFMEGGKKVRTLSGARWNSMIKRCLPGGHYQSARPRYKGCVNLFADFQSFVDWSMEQAGYSDTDENGQVYQLDKDLMIRGNKVYGPDTCIFVPAKVNSFFLVSNSAQGDHPVGVSFRKAKGKFVAQCNGTDGKPVHLGYFRDAASAHEAWKEFKAKRCEELASEFIESNPALHSVLMAWAKIIKGTVGEFCP